MGKYLESLFLRQHNQLGHAEQCFVDNHKKEIVEQIMHVIDCEAYMISKGCVYLREISVYRMYDHVTMIYQVYMPSVSFNEKSKYQVKKIHGLPVVRTKRMGDFLLYLEVWELLCNEFIRSADLVAYKSGTIERDLLRRLGTKGINIEILGCAKYIDLITKYGILPVRCQYHNPGDYHCSRHEVQIFARYLTELLIDTSSSGNMYKLVPMWDDVQRKAHEYNYYTLCG
ncbi:Hypothetical predicted protein [Paramuricea clavata]|uniref:Uncharacterized protein n=1 Tax=Paramuricea clavata TaxID=317549 RepID=A0A6S7FT13_PARCT|nr:Hypothetical predicted protein [Paramuricea clavata]